MRVSNSALNRRIAEVIGAKDQMIDFTVALDKLDKIGEEGVVKEMFEKGISQEAIEKVKPLFKISGSNSEQKYASKKHINITIAHIINAVFIFNLIIPYMLPGYSF